jgi:signal transduction histidine kinase
MKNQGDQSKPLLQGQEVADEAILSAEKSLVRILRWIFLAVGMPVVVFTFAREVLARSLTILMGLELLVFLVASMLALVFRNRHPIERWIMPVTLVVASTMAVFNFGPTNGVGAMQLAALLLATFFGGWRAGAGALAIVSGGLFLAAYLTVNGSHTPATFAPQAIAVWVRLNLTEISIMVALISMVHVLTARWRSAVISRTNAIQERRKAQLEKEESLKALVAAQRLAALGQLAGGMAHDFKNTLSAIKAGAGALAGDLEMSEEERREMARIIQDAVDAAAGTLDQVKRFGSVPLDSEEAVLPDEALKKLVRLVKPLFPRDIEVHLECTPTPPVALNPGIFEQMVLNLMLNARDALGASGRIELGCRSEGADAQALLWVEDDGPGISKEHQSKVFDTFFTTKREEGTGLGLSMVRRAVQMGGGTISLQSHAKGGTRFEIRLPSRL